MEPTAKRKIYELGYRYANAKTYLDRLLTLEKTILIDARCKPTGKPGWDQKDLKREYGSLYHWAECLGNENWWMKQPAPIKILDLKTGLRGLNIYLNEGYDLVLLCACAPMQGCHREVILNELRKEREFELITYTPSENIFRPVSAEVSASVEQVPLFDLPVEPSSYL